VTYLKFPREFSLKNRPKSCWKCPKMTKTRNPLFLYIAQRFRFCGILTASAVPLLQFHFCRKSLAFVTAFTSVDKESASAVPSAPAILRPHLGSRRCENFPPHLRLLLHSPFTASALPRSLLRARTCEPNSAGAIALDGRKFLTLF